MTFDDDFIRIKGENWTHNVPCKALGLSWPPPETLEFSGFVEAMGPTPVQMKLRRTRMSKITDEDRAIMTHVCRGAEYVVEPPSFQPGVH